MPTNKRIRAEPPVPICDGSDNSSSFCMPSTVTAFQVANMRSCEFCAYHKIDGKLVKLNEAVSKIAYLYVSPTDSKKLTRKDKLTLYKDGVRDLHVHKQYEGRLKCEYVGTKTIKEPISIKARDTPGTWIWWIVAVFAVIVFGCLIYYFRNFRTTESVKTVSHIAEPKIPDDPIVW